MTAPFRDRTDAGQKLGARLAADAQLTEWRRAGRPVLVLGLPRGGVPVAAGVASVLEAPLDVFIVRKLGVPGHEELAMGALASGGVRVLNFDVLENLPIPTAVLDEVTHRERHELERRERLFRGDRPALDVRDRIVILVDDGIATGATMRAALEALRRMDPARLLVAVPTAAPDTCAEFAARADGCVCLITPEPFRAVGLWYDDFEQTSDEQVRALLHQATRPGVPG